MRSQYRSATLSRQWVFLVLAVCACQADAKVIYVGQQQTSQSLAMSEVDHTTWNRLLQKYVNRRGLVDYAAWKSHESDLQSLSGYLDHLSAARVEPISSTNRSAQLAFWINAYNAVTVHGILREYPTDSIKDHVSRFGGYSIWKHYQLYVNGNPYSLDDMEHKVLRKMDEPRIHFAVVCASISCPRLLNEAYLPQSLEQQLAENTHDFFSQSGNFRYDAGKTPDVSVFDLEMVRNRFCANAGDSHEETSELSAHKARATSCGGRTITHQLSKI